MALRQVLLVFLILATLIIPLVQLSIGFYYVNSIELCPLQQDLMLLMSIGGVFEMVFFAAGFGFFFSITPAKYKTNKNLSAAQQSAKGGNGGTQLLIGTCSQLSSIDSLRFIV